MIRLFLLLTLMAPAVHAQAPELVLAEVDGEAITPAGLSRILEGAPAQAIQSAQNDPKEFLTWTWTMRRLRREAEQKGLDQKAPYGDRAAWSMGQVLMMAMIENQNRTQTPDDAELERHYAENAYRYGSAKVKVIFVASESGKEAAAQTKAQGLVKQARASADFGGLARKHSDDPESAGKAGDFGPIGADSRLPVEMRKVVFATRPGAVTEPIRQPAGFYIFQVVSIDLQPLAEVREKLRGDLRLERVNAWLAAQKAAIRVKLVAKEFFEDLKRQAVMGIAKGATPAADIEIQPGTVLAEISGRPLTAQELTGLLRGAPPQTRQKAMLQPEEFLGQYALMRSLSEKAERTGLAVMPPYRGRLDYDRSQILTQAAVDDYLNSIVVLPEEQRKPYDTGAERFRFARLRMLYVSYSFAPPPRTDPGAPKVLNEQEAQDKITSLAAEIRKGASFAQMVAQHSEDEKTKQNGGELPEMTPVTPNVPDAIRQPVFAAKKGDLVGPVKLPNGFYLFQVIDAGVKKYEEVKDQLLEEIRQQRFQGWFDGIRGSWKIQVHDAEAFRKAVRAQAQ